MTAAQLVTAPTPVIAQEPAEVGAIAPEGPVTVAVNMIAEPSAAVAELAVTLTVGDTEPTVVEVPEVVGAAK